MIKPLLDELEKSNEIHLDEGEAILKAYGGLLYPFDLLSLAVLNQSMSLTSGFIRLMRSHNFVAAAPLIRLQLDNFLKFAAAWLFPDPHKFATKILHGSAVKDLKTRDGKKMTDYYLISHFGREYKWIPNVYKNIDDFIHLSDRYLFLNMANVDSQKRTSHILISDKDYHIPEETKTEAIRAFTDITKLILHRAYSWRCTKDNPTD